MVGRGTGGTLKIQIIADGLLFNYGTESSFSLVKTHREHFEHVVIPGLCVTDMVVIDFVYDNRRSCRFPCV